MVSMATSEKELLEQKLLPIEGTGRGLSLASQSIARHNMCVTAPTGYSSGSAAGGAFGLDCGFALTIACQFRMAFQSRR